MYNLYTHVCVIHIQADYYMYNVHVLYIYIYMSKFCGMIIILQCSVQSLLLPYMSMYLVHTIHH